MNELTWLRGYFTGRLHAVSRNADRMVFHGVPIAWSRCGRATMIDSDPGPGWSVPCDRCVYLAGPPPVSAGQ